MRGQQGAAPSPGEAPGGPQGAAPSPGEAPGGPQGAAPSPGEAPGGPQGAAPSPGEAPGGPQGAAPSPGEAPEAECPVCYQEYNRYGKRPRVLDCRHVFCTECLQSLQHGDTLLCVQLLALGFWGLFVLTCLIGVVFGPNHLNN